MNSFRKHTGLVAPLDKANIDTDQIIPKQFLKRIERTGFGEFLFYDWRYLADGQTAAPSGQPALGGGLNPAFILNEPRFAGASILVAGKNFGCGSSREHAPWALAEYGFRVIISSSFADIFASNCFKNGMLAIALAEGEITEIMNRAQNGNGYQLTVDLERQVLEDSQGLSISFAVGGFQRYCLLEGLDDIALTLRHENEIKNYESSRPSWATQQN